VIVDLDTIDTIVGEKHVTGRLRVGEDDDGSTFISRWYADTTTNSTNIRSNTSDSTTLTILPPDTEEQLHLTLQATPDLSRPIGSTADVSTVGQIDIFTFNANMGATITSRTHHVMIMTGES